MSAPMCARFMARASVNFLLQQRYSGQGSVYLSIIQNRNYSRRGLRRKPVKVIFPKDETDIDEVPTRKPSFETTTPPRFRDGEHARFDRSGILHDEDETLAKLKYERVGPDDKRVRRVLTLMRSRKYREQTKKVLLEGRRLITDAILAGGECNTIYFSRAENLEGIPWHDTEAEFLKIPFKEIKLWSDVITPQGILAVFSMPSFKYFLYEASAETIPLTVICDNIREPGNLGALLRSAVAAGCQNILITKGCVDLWDLKVLRAAAGAHFRAPIHNNLTWESVKNYFDEETIVNVADCRTSVAIEEMMDDAESGKSRAPLNLRKLMKALPEEEGQETATDLEEQLVHIPSENFCDVNWRRNSAIVIGGESHGLSQQAVELCDETYGCKVHIPMTRGMDSLNSAMATSIIAFEAKRQWMNHLANINK